VRFTLGDTDKTCQLLSDEEINFLLCEQGSPLKAAIDGAKRIAAAAAKLVDEAVGRVKVSLSQRYKHFTELSKELSDELATKDFEVFAGGQKITQKDIVELDSNRVEPSFTVDKHSFTRDRDEDDRRCR